MRSHILTILAYATLALCQAPVPQLDTTITPFDLQILSPTNATLNNAKLSPCHREPAIESLCWSPDNHGNRSGHAPRFAFNASSKGSTSGTILYNMTNASSKSVYWEPLSLTYSFYTNIAIPLFQPGGRGTAVGGSRGAFGFDEEGKLLMWSAIDDRVAPIARSATPKALYRWFMCDINVPGAVRSPSTLAWGLGGGTPQNPTCQAVNVTRHYADIVPASPAVVRK